MAKMLSGMLMLRHLDEEDAANHLEDAIAEVIEEGESVTYDMKPSRDDPSAVGTSEVADAIVEKLGVRRVRVSGRSRSSAPGTRARPPRRCWRSATTPTSS